MSSRILVSAPRPGRLGFVLAALATGLLLAGCGQKGDLDLPTGAAAQNRATLPETLDPRSRGAAAVVPATPASAATTTGTASPVRVP